MATQGLKLEIVVPLEGMNQIALATVCVNVAEMAGIPINELMNYGRPLSVRNLKSQLKTRKTFLIEGKGLKAHLACITDFRFGYLTVDGLIDSALSKCFGRVRTVSTIISGRWIDEQYEHWQNAEDPLLYQVAGRSMDGLPMKDNGLPPPIGQLIVDTSRNPGRRVLRDGYVEAIGNRMWLGPEFFRRVPEVNREAVTSAQWLKVSEWPDDIIEIVAHHHPFVDESTADIQDRLRGLLFPTTCSRP